MIGVIVYTFVCIYKYMCIMGAYRCGNIDKCIAIAFEVGASVEEIALACDSNI